MTGTARELLEAALHDFNAPIICDHDDGFGGTGWIQCSRDAAVIAATPSGAELLAGYHRPEPPYDEAVLAIHRAFCEPIDELVGEWDRSMADALRRRGLAILPAPTAASNNALRDAILRAQAAEAERDRIRTLVRDARHQTDVPGRGRMLTIRTLLDAALAEASAS